MKYFLQYKLFENKNTDIDFFKSLIGTIIVCKKEYKIFNKLTSEIFAFTDDIMKVTDITVKIKTKIKDRDGYYQLKLDGKMEEEELYKHINYGTQLENIIIVVDNLTKIENVKHLLWRRSNCIPEIKSKSQFLKYFEIENFLKSKKLKNVNKRTGLFDQD